MLRPTLFCVLLFSLSLLVGCGSSNTVTEAADQDELTACVAEHGDQSVEEAEDPEG